MGRRLTATPTACAHRYTVGVCDSAKIRAAADRALAAHGPLGLRLTATPTACASVHGWRLGRRENFVALPTVRSQRAGPLGLRFNRNANGVRHRYTVCVCDGAKIRAAACRARTARGPLGLRLTATPTACASVHGWRLGRPENLWRCRPCAHSARPVGPAVKRGRQRRAHRYTVGVWDSLRICGAADRALTAQARWACG